MEFEDYASQLPWEIKPVKVGVIGDFILDEYLEGDVSRISPEAPVPVHLVHNNRVTAGGAANVARNIAMVGGSAVLFGVIGQDLAGDQLIASLDHDGIDTSSVFRATNRMTTKKTRITSNNQQLVRIDWEKPTPLEAKWQKQLIEALEQSQFDIAVISDYGKGGLTSDFLRQVMHCLNKRKIPVIVDPKGIDYSSYQGAYLITPNWKETCLAANVDHQEESDYVSTAEMLQKKFNLKNILVTLGERGMFFKSSDGKEDYYIQAFAREVFDVSGAGDTVVAVISMALASGLKINESMRLANVAAGKVVEKWGTQPIQKEELKKLLQQNQNKFGTTSSKITSQNESKQWLTTIRKSSKCIVFTNGCFDILHAGHISYLEAARSRGDLLIVGINTDSSVKKLKGSSRPIIPLAQRARLLAALACVDRVIPFSESTPKHLIDFIKPDILVKGADYQIDDIVGADTVLESGGKVERIPFVEGLSTSEIIRKVNLLSESPG